VRLIYDVGVESGDDSAYYLHKGFRVVGIEASPMAVEKLRERFAREIRDGRYILLPVGIAEDTGHATFWVCDDHPPWSSFDRTIASRRGSRHHCVTVETRPFRSILREFGPAAFCKIDIEGNDNFCIRDFTATTRPPYVSVELIDGDEQLRLLRDRGYSRFKIISQRTFRQPSLAFLRLDRRLPSPARRGITAAMSRLVRYQPDRDWRFPPGCSGPFGEETAGAWRTFEEASLTCEEIGRASNQPFDWHDIHARLDAA